MSTPGELSPSRETSLCSACYSRSLPVSTHCVHLSQSQSINWDFSLFPEHHPKVGVKAETWKDLVRCLNAFIGPRNKDHPSQVKSVWTVTLQACSIQPCSQCPGSCDKSNFLARCQGPALLPTSSVALGRFLNLPLLQRLIYKIGVIRIVLIK